MHVLLLSLTVTVAAASRAFAGSPAGVPVRRATPSAAGRAHAPAAVAAARDSVRWTAQLTTPAAGPADAAEAHVRGRSRVAAGDSGAVASVSLTHAQAGATHPWHVHRGTCGHDQGIVGGAAAYSPMVVDAAGNGTSTAKIPVPMAAEGSYFLNVHASPSDLKTIVACGPLTRATASGSKAAMLGGR